MVIQQSPGTPEKRLSFLFNYHGTLRPSTVVFFNVTRSGGTKNANQRGKATDTKAASVDVTRAVRPHTAHGTRATDIGGEVSASQGAFGEGGEAAPVVAGARGMIR